MRIEQRLSIALFLISVGNFIDCVINGDDIYAYLIWVIPLILPAIILLFIKTNLSKKTVSILLLIIAFMSIVMSEKDSLNGFFFFLFALYLSNRKISTYWVFGVCAISALMIRFTIISLPSHSTINYIAGIFFVYSIYMEYIHPKKCNYSYNSIKTTYKPGMVSSDVVDILRLHVLGYDWPEINDILTEERCDKKKKRLDSQLVRVVREERNEHGFKNQDQFIFWLLENDVLKPVSDGLNTDGINRDSL